MADRLTQLQDAVNVQAENLTNSVGLLQQFAKPQPFPEFDSFEREKSKAYQQVLNEAGISLDLPSSNDNDNKDDDNDNNNKEKSSSATSNGTIGIVDDNGQPSRQEQSSNDNNKKEENNDAVAAAAADDNNLNFDDNSKLFAKLITKTAKDISTIIDSLPEKMEPGMQEGHINRLELENLDEAKLLEEFIIKAENLLEIIQKASEDIAQNQMTMKQLEAQMLTVSPIHSSSTSTSLTSQFINNNNQLNLNNLSSLASTSSSKAASTTIPTTASNPTTSIETSNNIDIIDDNNDDDVIVEQNGSNDDELMN